MSRRLALAVLATGLALALLSAGLLAGCGASGKKPRSYQTSTTVAGVGSGGLAGGGVGSTIRSAPLKHLKVHSAPPIQLPIIAMVRGPNDPHDLDLSLLTPRRARLRQVWFIHGGRQPDQVLIEWVRSKAPSLYYTRPFPSVRWGLTLWTQTPPAPDTLFAPWRGVAIPLVSASPGVGFLRVALADVTSDGHPDVLVEQYPGTNHGCGPHQVVATLERVRTWRIFLASLCETPLRGSGGLLALDLPYYLPGESLCCWSKVEKLRLRLNGKRYVTVSDVIVPIRH